MELTFDFFSPEHFLDLSLAREKKVNIFVKRDDLMHPYISGNKWRKLKYLLIKARSERKKNLVTFGGAWSNHLLATACAAAQFKFISTAYVRGEEVNNPVLALCQLFGMKIIFVSRTEYQEKQMLFEKHHGSDPQAFFIEEGGYSPEGAKGCEEIISELTETYNHIFAACGTGTTLAGVAMGAATHQPQAVVHGVPVLKGGEFIKDTVRNLYPGAEFTLHTDFHFGGYAKVKSELSSFINEFCKSTGILIEPVYTGKLFFALRELLLNDYFNEGDNILVIHSGGLTGYLGQYLKLTEPSQNIR